MKDEAAVWNHTCDSREVGNKILLQLPFPSQSWIAVLHRLSDYTKVAGDLLLRQVCMYQELWSAAPGPAKHWICRAVIFWRFTKKTKGATTWRFLSRIDPSSEYHRERIFGKTEALRLVSDTDILPASVTSVGQRTGCAPFSLSVEGHREANDRASRPEPPQSSCPRHAALQIYG